MCFWLSLPTYSAPRRCGRLKSTWMVPHCQSRPRLSFSVNSRLTPMASVAALGHRKMQAFFCDTRFAHFSGRRRRLRPGSGCSRGQRASWLRRGRLQPCPRFRRNPRAFPGGWRTSPRYRRNRSRGRFPSRGRRSLPLRLRLFWAFPTSWVGLYSGGNRLRLRLSLTSQNQASLRESCPQGVTIPNA